MWWNQATPSSQPMQTPVGAPRVVSPMSPQAESAISTLRSSLSLARRREQYYHHTAIDLQFELEQAVICHQQQIEALLAELESKQSENESAQAAYQDLLQASKSQQKELSSSQRTAKKQSIQAARRLRRTHRIHDRQMGDCLDEWTAQANSQSRQLERTTEDRTRLEQENHSMRARIQELEQELQQQKRTVVETSGALAQLEIGRVNDLSLMNELKQESAKHREQHESLVVHLEMVCSEYRLATQTHEDQIAWYQHLTDRLGAELEEEQRSCRKLEQSSASESDARAELELKIRQAACDEYDLREQLASEKSAAAFALNTAEQLCEQMLRTRSEFSRTQVRAESNDKNATKREAAVRSEYNQQLSTLEYRIHDIQRQAVESACRAAAAEQQGGELRDANRLLEKRCELLEHDNQRLKLVAENHQKQQLAFAEKCKVADSQIALVNAQIHEVQQSRDNLEGENQALVEQVANLKHESRRLTEQLGASECETRILKDRAETFRRQSEASEKRSRRLEHRTRRLQRRFDHITERLKSADKKAKQLSCELEESSKRARAKELELASAAERIGQLEVLQESLEENLREINIAPASVKQRASESIRYQLCQREAVEILLTEALERQTILQQKYEELQTQQGKQQEPRSTGSETRTLSRYQAEITRLQAQLRREASERRKAESALVRAVEFSDDDPALKAVFDEHQANQRIERMEKLLQATENLNRYNQAKASKKIRRLQQAVQDRELAIERPASRQQPEAVVEQN